MFSWVVLIGALLILLASSLMINSFTMMYFKCATRDRYTGVLTVLMPTFNRDIVTVQRIINHYEQLQIVHEVIVLEFDGGHSVGHQRTALLPNDLRNRFAPHRFPQKSEKVCPAIITDAIVTVDDDCVLTEDLLQNIYVRLQERPDALHGIEGRNLIDGNYQPYERPKVVRGGSRVGMLLTWCAMAKTDRMRKAEDLFREKYFDFAMPLNGEDIAISRIFGECVMHEFGWVTWAGHPIFNTEIRFLTTDFSLSSKKGFIEERQQISQNFNAVGLSRASSQHDSQYLPTASSVRPWAQPCVLGLAKYRASVGVAMTAFIVLVVIIIHTNMKRF